AAIRAERPRHRCFWLFTGHLDAANQEAVANSDLFAAKNDIMRHAHAIKDLITTHGDSDESSAGVDRETLVNGGVIPRSQVSVARAPRFRSSAFFTERTSPTR